MAWADPDMSSKTAATGELNGEYITINTSHASFKNDSQSNLGRTIMHEGGHNIGLTHPDSSNGVGFNSIPYREGGAFQRKAYKLMKTLNPTGTVGNPDHIASAVYP